MDAKIQLLKRIILATKKMSKACFNSIKSHQKSSLLIKINNKRRELLSFNLKMLCQTKRNIISKTTLRTIKFTIKTINSSLIIIKNRTLMIPLTRITSTRQLVQVSSNWGTHRLLKWTLSTKWLKMIAQGLQSVTMSMMKHSHLGRRILKSLLN